MPRRSAPSRARSCERRERATRASRSATPRRRPPPCPPASSRRGGLRQRTLGRFDSGTLDVLGVIAGEQFLLLFLPREGEEDEYCSEQDSNESGGVGPLVAL